MLASALRARCRFLLAPRFSAHGVVCCRRRSIVNCGASDITTLLSSAPVLVCVFFFFLWSASETEVPRADDNRLLRHFGGSLAMLRMIALHRKWCLRRTVCVVSSCGLASSQFRFLFCFLFLAIFFCPPPPARVSVVLLLPVCGVCLRCGPCVYYVHIVVYIV